MSAAGIVSRFAPSPTGDLHLGHALSALTAFEVADGGRFILRIEDIDRGRCRPEYEAALLEDLAWLGLTWEEPVRRQSEHMADYAAALDRLKALGVVYPCFCTRKEIEAEIEAAGGAPHGPDGPLYPGICRPLSAEERARRIAEGIPHAWRIDGAAAIAAAGPLSWMDAQAGTVAATPELLGDAVLARKDVATSYHLAVTVDDALQGVTDVVRGVDLFHASHLHRLLQALLGLPVPRYHHHRLLVGPDGKRYAKRDRSVTLRDLRSAGHSPADIRAMIGMAKSG